MSRIVALAESMQAVVLSTMLDGTLRAELQAHCDSANVNAMVSPFLSRDADDHPRERERVTTLL
eukprot:1699608-Rhodomonas_salina.5